jgi:hypothetical protein
MGNKKKGQIFTVNGLICCAWASFLSLSHKHTQSPAAAAAAALDQKENWNPEIDALLGRARVRSKKRNSCGFPVGIWGTCASSNAVQETRSGTFFFFLYFSPNTNGALQPNQSQPAVRPKRRVSYIAELDMLEKEEKKKKKKKKSARRSDGQWPKPDSGFPSRRRLVPPGGIGWNGLF